MVMIQMKSKLLNDLIHYFVDFILSFFFSDQEDYSDDDDVVLLPNAWTQS